MLSSVSVFSKISTIIYCFYNQKTAFKEGRHSFDKSFQYKQITNPSEKYLELHRVCCCDQDKFSGNVLMIKREGGGT